MRSLAALSLLAAPLAAQQRVVDDFESVAAWTAAPGEGVELTVGTAPGRAGRALALAFDFRGRAGYAVARRRVALDLPENYELSFWIRGPAPSNTLEFKLIDSTGANVWWSVRRNFTPSGQWVRVAIPRRHVSFAWGPAGGGELRRATAIEIAITAGTGGKGTVLIDDLSLERREPLREYVARPVAAGTGTAPSRAVDGDTTTAWVASGRTPVLTVDFGQVRLFGGVSLVWEPGSSPARAEIAASADGRRWTVLDTIVPSGDRDHARLPETEARWLRLALSRPGSGRVALRELLLRPAEWSATPVALLTAVARDAPRGHYPRYLLGEQSYWTVIGSADDTSEALISEDGAVETSPGGPSLEPFVELDGDILSWGDAAIDQSLARRSLPVPSVRLQWARAALEVTAAAPPRGAIAPVMVRYRLFNRTSGVLGATLHLALRPFQVNPSWQFLGTPGGPASVGTVRFAADALVADGVPLVLPLSGPDTVITTAFLGGDVVRVIAGNAPAARRSGEDSLTSAVLAFRRSIAPGDSSDVLVLLPLGGGERTAAAERFRAAAAMPEAHADAWATHLAGPELRGPPVVDTIARAIEASLAYILVNRDGRAIQPGSRSYSRSWIRDGALTSTALLRLRRFDEVRRFIDWFVPFQYPSGRAPCCVDRRGADPVPEHDSTGELIYLIAEYVRMSADTAAGRAYWPAVERGARFLDSLRHERLTDVYRSPDSLIFYGLLPPSISHEGYSAKPVHSYWDDFFALRGFKDAAWLAAALGRADDARHWRGVADAFRRDFFASIELVRRRNGLSVVPGSADLADFDATSTTIALDPVGEESALPHDALAATFERYHAEAMRRRDTTAGWDAYTPYEWRNVGALVRLGERAKALEVFGLLLADRRPSAWNQWGEVVWRQRRIDRFIGDMPHTWVASDFVRSALDLFAYERAGDSSIVLLGGVARDWLAGEGVTLRGLGTTRGALSLSARELPGGLAVSYRLEGVAPAGGFVLDAPAPERRLREVRVDGRILAPSPDGIVRIRASSAEVRLRY